MTPPLGTLEYLYIGTANFERDCANSRTPAGTPTPYFREDTIDSFPGGRLLSRRPVSQAQNARASFQLMHTTGCSSAWSKPGFFQSARCWRRQPYAPDQSR